ncbi:MAG: hypothetical protein A3E01_05300 [Gammaproteobacteria bacterium RIFCSPHIGHO2_12_FULL_63_22]|nr:MAG: hypothetical protein A3E01_05300 [Gammaproteobacteria bacterium RIFCSPHIGHO2_12_FULL_63_22]
MANKPTPAPKSKEVAVEMAAIEQTMAAANQLAVATLEQNERVGALALQLNYQGSTDPGALENSARDAIKRIGMAIFELGAYLLLLKEGCAHGEFMPVLERLGINQHSANKYMAVTQRFANSSTSTNLEKLGFSKMAELLPLEDDQVDELASDGQTGELSLDDVSRMSVRELRAAVRKERAEAAKQKSQVDRLTAVNTELHEEARLIKRLPASEELKRTQREAANIQAEAMGLIQGGVRHALIALNNCEQDQSLFMAGMVGQLISELATLRDEFSLPEVGGTPEWERWAQAQGAAAKAN